jgi:hypothetical protein
VVDGTAINRRDRQAIGSNRLIGFVALAVTPIGVTAERVTGGSPG